MEGRRCLIYKTFLHLCTASSKHKCWDARVGVFDLIIHVKSSCSRKLKREKMRFAHNYLRHYTVRIICILLTSYIWNVCHLTSITFKKIDTFRSIRKICLLGKKKRVYSESSNAIFPNQSSADELYTAIRLRRDSRWHIIEGTDTATFHSRCSSRYKNNQ